MVPWSSGQDIGLSESSNPSSNLGGTLYVLTKTIFVGLLIRSTCFFFFEKNILI